MAIILFLRYLWHLLLSFISPLATVLYRISFLFILMLIAFYALVFNGQANDLFVAFAEDYRSGTYMFLFTVALIIWANTVWLSSRIIFIISGLKPDYSYLTNELAAFDRRLPDKAVLETRIKNFMVWVPRSLCAITYIIIVVAYFKANGFASFRWYPLVVIVTGALHVFYLYKRSYFLSKLIKGFDKRKYYSIREDLNSLGLKALLKSPYFRIETWSSLIIDALLLAGLMFVPDFRYFLRAGTIILIAFATYSFISLIIDWKGNRWQIPIIPFFILLFFVFGMWNNNHRIYDMGVQSTAEVNNRKPDSVYFREWLNYKISNGVFDTAKSSIPVYLIASEGGGSRACYWTTTLLTRLHQSVPSLYDHTFAASGVSGGNAGLGLFYTSLANEKAIKNPDFFKKDSLRNINLMAAEDFLSNVTYAFVGPDMLQRFLPVPVEFNKSKFTTDRGKYLSSSFNKAFNKYYGQAGISVNNSFLKMWQEKNAYAYPALLLNATHVEDGNKAVFSPFALNEKFYADTRDILSIMKKSVPLKEAITSCARFPAITPPGLVYSYNEATGKEKKWGHIVDGGYFENTAVQTCVQTKLMMDDVIDKHFQSLKQKIKIIVVGIQIQKCYGDSKAMGFNYEMAPLTAVTGVPFRWIWGADSMFKRMDKNYEAVKFELINNYYKTNNGEKKKTKKNALPLGWYLSQISKDIIYCQAMNIDKGCSRVNTDSACEKRIVQNNRESFVHLVQSANDK